MRLITVIAAALWLAGCIHIYEPRATQGGPSAAAATPSSSAAKPADGMKAWNDALKDTKPIDGYIKVHQKRDNTLFIELRPDQLDQDFGLIMHISRGTGVFNIQDGLPLSGSRLMRFQRTGDKIYLVQMNTRFTAAQGSPMRLSLDDNIGHSIAASFKVESEHKDTKAVLIDATPFLLSDYAQIADNIKPYYGNKPVTFERDRSYVEKVQAFPKNNEIDALLTFRASEPPVANSAGVSDWRSIPVGVRYSFFALPEKPMQARLFDDRVGYFTTTIRDFSRDQAFDPYIRMVNRWRLEKKDPSAELSEPVTPIVYYIDRSVPQEYRKHVKAGIENWNKAFEKAGFRNAVVAKEAPENDPTWSAEDIRYSTVRWTAAHQMGYAIGPSQTDPRTGEILNADILISSTFVTGWANSWQTYSTPEAFVQQIQDQRLVGSNLPEHMLEKLCMMENGLSHQLGLHYEALLANGTLDPGSPMPEVYLSEAIIELTLHEVGHTLGLRHNMKASSAIPYDKLNDKQYTLKHGLTLSVMDYAPVNIALNSSNQGQYYSSEVGSYDEWAITYGYAPVYEQPATGPFVKASGSLVLDTEAEQPALRKIASLAADPLHTYGTDEDTHLGPFSVDPHSNTWDLTADPLRWATERVALVRGIQPKLEQRLVADGDAYTRLRGSLSGLIFQRFNALYPATKVIGGMHFVRDHKGDPNARSPFTPVPAARQREALKLIMDNAFAEDAFKFDARLLNSLPPARAIDWSGTWAVTPIDYPVHEWVDAIQSMLLQDILHPARFRRMIDNNVRMLNGAEAFGVDDLFKTLTDGIWSELGARKNINSFRRNLQRRHLDQMTRLLLDVRATPTSPAVPEDARSLARHDLTNLARRVGQTINVESLDTNTRAHLAESKARIDRVLEASITLPAR